MDALLDPTTGDYAGQRTQTLANAVYLRLMTPLGSYWAAPKVGSKLHLLQREKDTSRVRQLAAQYAEQALAPLVKDGRAQRVTVTTAGPSGRQILSITVLDASGEPQYFQHPVKVA
jgi:phage gp46-like protein